jgi:glyoxylase-like metal-dependent hydrolase (beta-lactamase superfamily II)
VGQCLRRNFYHCHSPGAGFLHFPEEIYQQLCQFRNKMMFDTSLDLHFLGIGSAFNPALGNTSAWFRLGEELYILDCGETVFERLVRLPELEACAKVYVLISHLHNDHAGSLAALASYCCFTLDKKICVIHPAETVNSLLALQGIHADEYVYGRDLPACARASLEIHEVPHAADMECYAYIVRSGPASFYFSGDAATVPADIVRDFKKGTIGRIYQDTSLYQGKGHCSLAQLEEKFSPELRKRVYCMHFEEGGREAAGRAGFSLAALDDA